MVKSRLTNIKGSDVNNINSSSSLALKTCANPSLSFNHFNIIKIL